MLHLNRKLLLLLLVLAYWNHHLIAEENIKDLDLSADVSFLIVDIKYHPERGAQICEIQHGTASAFRGDTFSNGGTCIIAKNFVNLLSPFYEQSWTMTEGLSDLSIISLLKNNQKWTNFDNINSLTTNPQLLAKAGLPVNDPSDLSAYHGFVFVSATRINNRENFQKRFPGILLIDNAFHAYKIDKLKMTELLMGHPLTEEHKPKWGAYDKKSDFDLAEVIRHDIDSEIYVIKPLHRSRGDGVIIVSKDELNRALDYVCKKIPKNQRNDLGPDYAYWYSDNTSQFIVEEFIPVEPIVVSHLDGKLYSPTLRLAFVLFYSKKKIVIECLGGYYSFPKKAVTEEGTLGEKYKACCQIPYYSKPDPEIVIRAEEQMKAVLDIIYQKALGI